MRIQIGRRAESKIAENRSFLESAKSGIFGGFRGLEGTFSDFSAWEVSWSEAHGHAASVPASSEGLSGREHGHSMQKVQIGEFEPKA